MEANKSEYLLDVPIVSDDILFIVSIVNYVVLCEVFALFGVVTNIINMVVYSRMGFRDSINVSLFGLAFSDCGSCFTLILVGVFINPWIIDLDLPFYPEEIQYLIASVPHVIFTKITTVITAFVTFERCLCVTIPLKVKSIINLRRVKCFMVFGYLLVLSTSLPFYYYNRYAWRHDPSTNKSVLGLFFASGRNEFEAWYLSLHNLFYSIFAFIFISICTGVLVVTLKRKAAWRQTATTVTTSNESSNKENKISKMVVLISSLFIACFLPTVIILIMMSTDRNLSVTGTQVNLLKTFSSFTFFLESVNSSMNIFIYYYNSSNYRAKFDQIFCFRGRADPVKAQERLSNENKL